MACLQQDVAFLLVAHCCELHIISAIIYIHIFFFMRKKGMLLRLTEMFAFSMSHLEPCWKR